MTFPKSQVWDHRRFSNAFRKWKLDEMIDAYLGIHVFRFRVANFAENKQSLIPLMVHYDGKIQWNQPVLLVSTCNIRIR